MTLRHELIDGLFCKALFHIAFGYAAHTRERIVLWLGFPDRRRHVVTDGAQRTTLDNDLWTTS